MAQALLSVPAQCVASASVVRILGVSGRWRSLCYRLYLDPQDEELLLASQAVVQAIQGREGEGQGWEGLVQRIETCIERDSWVGQRRAQ